MATPRIRSANAASTSTLAPELPKQVTLKNGKTYEISLVKSEHLSSQAQDAIFKLFDRNMLALQSKSSFPYTETSKREELFDPDARYIILRAPSTSSSSSSSSSPIVETIKSITGATSRAQQNGKTKGKGRTVNVEVDKVDFGSEDLLGFCGFRFDTEETLSSRDAEVVYCYEVQLSSESRGLGLGRTLLDILEDVGRRRALDKVMLTCLMSNESALAFYTKQGYTPDEIDPTRINEEEDTSSGSEEEEESDGEVDYKILSKSLKSI